MIQRTSARRGLTVLELLIVIGMVAVLMALLMPAVQSARDQARAARCRNNLKQIGLALHNYLDVFNTFPPGWVAHSDSPDYGPAFGWMVMLLPFVDQAPLYNQLDFQKPPPAPNKLLQQRLDIFRCPMDPTEDVNGLRSNYSTSNYSGNHGDEPLPRWTADRLSLHWPGNPPTPKQASGILFLNSSVRFRDITDGASNTFAAGERSITSGSGIWVGVAANAMENDAVTECSHSSRINAGLTSFSSRHGAGANILMCDGAVRFISADLDSRPADGGDPGTFQRLGHKSDGLAIGEF